MHLYDPNGSIHAERLRRERKENIQSLAFAVAVVLGGAGPVRAGVLRGGEHAHSHDCQYRDHAGVAAHVFGFVPQLFRGGPGGGVGLGDCGDSQCNDYQPVAWPALLPLAQTVIVPALRDA